MRAAIGIAVLLALTGCNSGRANTQATNAKTTARTERCTQRFLDGLEKDGAAMRSYVETAYCGPFAKRGFVYADGTLSIKAQLYILSGNACSSTTLTPDGQTTTLPCDPKAALLNPLDCAILHYVRKGEVEAYIRKLEHSQKVRCDDGTPLDELGAT